MTSTTWKASKYGVFSGAYFQTEYRKMRIRKSPYLDTFHAVILSSKNCLFSGQKSTKLCWTKLTRPSLSFGRSYCYLLKNLSAWSNIKMESRTDSVTLQDFSRNKHNNHNQCMKWYFEQIVVSNKVRNSRVTKLSYETELRKVTSHFELLTQKSL